MLAYGIGGILAAAGVVVSYLYTGSAMATTAIGTLIPILKDAGEIKTRFGTYLLAAGGMGEFGPILLITLILSTTNPLHEALILVAFVVVAVITGRRRRSARPGGAGRWWSERSRPAASSPCDSRSSWSSAWWRWRPSSAWTSCWAASSPG